MAILLNDARSAFGRYKQDITDVSNTDFVEWCDFINKSLYRKLIAVDPERYIVTQAYTVSTSPSTQALPTSPVFKTIQPFGCGFYLVDSNGDNTNVTLAQTGHGSKEPGYYISGSNVIFTGLENESVLLRFIPELTPLDELTDYFTVDSSLTGVETVPDEYLQTLIKAIDVLYNQWDEDPGAESLADFRFVRLLDEMLDDIRKGPNVYGLQNFADFY